MPLSVIGDNSLSRAVGGALRDEPEDWTWVGPGPATFSVSQARVALRHGRPVLMYWPEDATPSDADGLVRTAEEAGVEVGVARAHRHEPEISLLLAGRPLSFVSMHGTVSDPARLHASAGELLDVAVTLAGGGDVLRSDVERAGAGLAISVRLQSGTVVHALMGLGDEDRYELLGIPSRTNRAVRHAGRITSYRESLDAHVAAARAFGRAVRDSHSAPTALADALPLLRVLDRTALPMR